MPRRGTHLELPLYRQAHVWGRAMLWGCAWLLASDLLSNDVEHTLSFGNAGTHYVGVDSVFPTAGQAEVELVMAVWTPGSYMVRDYSRNVEELVALNEWGEALSVQKSRKNRWRIATGGSATIKVRYNVYSRTLSVQSNWVEADFAMLNGAPTFLDLADSVEGERSRGHVVSLKLPPEWKHSVTGLPPHGDAPHTYRAESFDVLLDAPLLLGNPAVYTFEVGGKEHLLANQGERGIWDGPRSAADVEKIVEAHYRFWGQLPYERYVFLNVIEEGSGGLEHLNSTLLLTSRWNSRVPKNYRRWLGLVSHEFFHTWNVKRLRPVELGPFDYETEVHTKSLWIAEGLTSYYDDLLLHRAGLYTEKQYLEALSRQIEILQTTPGRRFHSLEMSSYDSWIKFYRRDENSKNSTISYYTKGAVVGFLLDAEIRRASGGERSLDDVVRLAYERYSEARGFTPEEFRAVISEVAGSDLSSWLSKALETTAELDYANALEWYGLRFKDPEKKAVKETVKDGGEEGAEERPETADAPTPPEEAGDEDDRKKSYVGVTTAVEDGRLLIKSVRRGTPAYAAGLNAEDEILAIDGFRVQARSWTERLDQYQPGAQVEFLVARRERLLRLSLTLAEKPAKLWNLEKVEKATQEQEARLRAWLTGS